MAGLARANADGAGLVEPSPNRSATDSRFSRFHQSVAVYPDGRRMAERPAIALSGEKP
jgi:hypothetical protein